MKHILFITGTRADFGKQKSLMRIVNDSPEFKCSVFVTGMHLLHKYGSTLEEVKKENFENIFYYFNQLTDMNHHMDLVLTETIKGLSFYIAENHVDMIVVHGDRVEALAGAIVGLLNGILTAHIEGGERSGTIDESMRHAISKLANIHFVATKENKKRLLQMGETFDNIFVIGSPDIDILLSKNLVSIEEVKRYYEIEFDKYAIFIYHPVVTELSKIKDNIYQVIDAAKRSQKNYVVIYPNNDLGSSFIVSELENLKNNKKFKIFPSIRFEYYLSILKNSEFILGNSSSGIHEAPIYGIPTINIGTRQNGRFTCNSIFNVAENSDDILSIIKNLQKNFSPIYTYGSGNSAELFLKIIKKSSFWQTTQQKIFHDLKWN